MIKFLMRLFAAKPAPRRPMAIRRRRINPVYLLQAERRDDLAGKIGTRITGFERGNDERAS